MKLIDEVKVNKIYVGTSLSDDFLKIIKDENLSDKKVLLITGASIFDKSNWKPEFLQSLSVSNIHIIQHLRVLPNPVAFDVNAVDVNYGDIDLIICVGGGSVIDFAKLLKMRFCQQVKILAFYTLVGSGTIVTPFTIYNNDEFKIGDHSADIIPNIVYINENIINDLPNDKKIGAICDISAHAIESYISKAATDDSRSFALKSFEILRNNILNIKSISANDLIMADIYAALSESEGLVLLPHAVGHYLTYKFGVDHNISSMYFLEDYLNLLPEEDDKIRQFKKYTTDLQLILDEANLLPHSILREDHLRELIDLVKKYMPFVFENSPINISDSKILEILRTKRCSHSQDTINSLNRTIKQAQKSLFYADKLKNIDGVKGVDELRLLPFTTKKDLRSAYPFGTLAINFKDVIEMHTTSGTTGKPTLSFYNKEDITTGSKAIAEAWANFGINNESRIQFIMSYGLFSGAMLNTYALQELGAFVLPSGIQPIEKQINLLIDFKIDTIVATPSYLLHLADYLNNHEDYKNELKLVRAIAAGEIYSDVVREDIQNKLGIKVYDHYGLCEVNTGITYECDFKDGLHVLDDYVIAEIIDPITGNILPDGEYGELVLTSLKKEASPIIRYRTGDITCIKTGQCACGSGRIRVDRIKTRIDDILFIRGLKINPHELKEMITSIVGDNLYCGCIKITTKKNSIDFIPQISLFVKDINMDIKDLQKKIKDKCLVNFDFKAINYQDANLFENTKIKLIEYVD